MGDVMKFAEAYYTQLREVVEQFDKAPLEQIVQVFFAVSRNDGTLWVAGNGGSAAIADHTVCDATKTAFVEGQPSLRTISLSANGPMLTAIGNDIAYEAIFSEQLRYYLGNDDAVLLVSSSGNSPNVVQACRYALDRGVPTIAFVGFEGGELAALADHVVHIRANNYGIAEDVHQSLMHVLTQYLKLHRTQSKA
jgi:phosphoheptose isomerase